MMRSGKLLEEGEPNYLLEKYNQPSLEEVFLGLCKKDGDIETANGRENRKNRPPIVKKNGDSSKNQGYKVFPYCIVGYLLILWQCRSLSDFGLKMQKAMQGDGEAVALHCFLYF